MIPRIKQVIPQEKYILFVSFDDGKQVMYDLKDDINELPGYGILSSVPGLFEQVQLDESRTCISWNTEVDLPSDTIYEYGIPVTKEK